jgi:hypothetical protein
MLSIEPSFEDEDLEHRATRTTSAGRHGGTLLTVNNPNCEDDGLPEEYEMNKSERT